MQTNKIGKLLEEDLEKLMSETKSNTDLNRQFWNSLKDTINTKKETSSIKGGIFTAKRILTPIIQELMRDALQQIEADDREALKGARNVEVLYNNIRAKDIFHAQKDTCTGGKEWAMRILSEINRDLEQPFDKLVKNEGEHVKRSARNMRLNEKLLTKLEPIHQHLGNIIDRLKDSTKIGKTSNFDKTIDHEGNQCENAEEIEDSPNKDYPSRRKLERTFKSYFMNSFQYGQLNEGPFSPSSRTCEIGCISHEREDRIKSENICQPANFGNEEKYFEGSPTNKHQHDATASYHAIFEEKRNEAGNRQIVIKCLGDLEKVRTYLEALRDNKDCEKPIFTDLESCKNNACNESQPHLHSFLHDSPIVLKLNKHAEDNERKSDLIIGIPTLTSNSPDVQILLNTKDHHIDISPFCVQERREHKTCYRISRTCKLIEKKRDVLSKPYSRYSSKSSLNEKRSPCKKATNLLIFDPDDPCKSIIKMKEQKNLELYGPKSVVSNRRLTLFHKMLLKFFYVGGRSRDLNVEIKQLLFVEWLFESKNYRAEVSYSREKYKFVLIFFLKYSLYLKPSLDYCSILNSEKCCVSVKKHNSIIFGKQAYLDWYVKYILNFISIMKGSRKNNSKVIKSADEKRFQHTIDFDYINPQVATTHTVYFFECIKENKKKAKPEPSVEKGWNIPLQEPEAYPVWTIKRSKYYSVPQSTKKSGKVLLDKMGEKPDSLRMDEDSLEILSDPHKEIQVQISKISVPNSTRATDDSINADGEKPAKTEIKRKVSFRDEVDVPDAIEQKEAVVCQNSPPKECDDSYFEDIEYDPEKAPSLELEKDLKEISSRISDLLMTDSLMKITEELSRESSKNKTLEALKFTESAKNILAKLSKSFGNETPSRNSSKVVEDTLKQFYDKEGNLITEVCDSEGDLLFKLKNNNARKLISVLFDSRGSIDKNIYNSEGERIESVYDENGRTIRHRSQIFEEFKNERNDFETVEFFDWKNESSIFEYSGEEMDTVERDSPKISEAGEKHHGDFYKREGKKIELEYDSHSRVTKSFSFTELEPILRKEQVRMVKVDSNTKKKIEVVKKSVNFENDNLLKRNSSPKKFFDKEGNLLTGVYDKKGKPIKLTTSGEADELLPFLFNDKGKLQKKRYDSQGKELKAVFGEDGSVISEMSLTWLNELLAKSTANNSNTSAKYKKKSFFRRTKKSSEIIQKHFDIEKLYDSNGKILTSVFDSKGKSLAESPSGDANKLIPFLFDSGGKFIKKRFDNQKQKIRFVYRDDGNVVNNIPVSYLNKILEKLKNHQKQVEMKDDHKNLNSRRKSLEKDIEHSESNKIIDIFDYVPDELFDKDGNILKEVIDCNGNILETSSSGNGWRLLPHLFDAQGHFLKKRYDRRGRELLAVYNKAGENLNDYLSAAIKMTIGKDKLAEKWNKNEHGVRKIEKIKSSSISGENYSTKANKADIIARKEKLDKRQLKPTSSIMDKTSINRAFVMSKMVLKKGSSIYRFYDEGGNAITEVYDSKGRNLIRTNSEDVEELAKFLFTEEGFLADNIHDRRGRRIDRIFDHSKRSISRISISSIISEDNMKNEEENERIPGRVYDVKGNLLREIYDRKGSPILITKLARLKDLAPVIFDEKGVRRKLFDKSGNEIGLLFDYKGEELKHSPKSKKKRCIDKKNTKIFSKTGKLLRNFYDSEGSLIIALYNGSEKLLCDIERDENNAEKLSKFFFDKDGNFLRRRLYNFRGQLMKHVYDSKSNLIRSIKRAKFESVPRPRTQHVDENKDVSKKQTGNVRESSRDKADHINRRQYEKDGKKRTQHVRNLASQSDTMINPSSPIVQRSISAYSLRDYPKRKEKDETKKDLSDHSLIKITIKKFYDENGRLLTGVYNSKTRLLGYSASGNARVLAPYLFDLDGNFISGRYNLHRKPLRHVYDSEGFLVKKISKPSLKKTKGVKKCSARAERFKIHDKNGNVVTSVYDFDGDKIFDVTDSSDKISVLFDNRGKLKKNLYNCKGSKLQIYDVKQSVPSDRQDDEESSDEIRESKQRFSILSNLRDKILTVVFDNPLSRPEEFSVKLPERKRDSNEKTCVSKREEDCLYDDSMNLITDLYDDRGRKITEVFNSDGDLIDELYSVSGTLIKNSVLKNMFEDNVFKPKVYNSRGNLITAVYANKKLLTDVYDENGSLSAVDSDLVYMVSKQSLPADDRCESMPKQVNSFSEEGQKQIGQVNIEPFTVQDFNYENEMKIAFNGYTRRTDKCVCENCLSRNRNNHFVQFGGEIFSRLSRLATPLSKLLLPGFFRRSSEQIEEVDSLETLIDQAETDLSSETIESDKQYFIQSAGSISVMHEKEENALISRKMIEKTLRNCVHFNSSTNVIGNVSDTVLQHYVTLVLREIEKKFYRKLEVLHCGGSHVDNSSKGIVRDFEKDICIGTEHKFEDSSIGRHSVAQTSCFSICQDDICHNPSNRSSWNVKMKSYMNKNLEQRNDQNGKAFVCKVPNLQPFIVMMKTKVQKK